MSGTGRWGQLTYATFDSATATSGGWQVKQESAGLAPAEREHLLASVTTSLDPPRSLGRFLGPDQVAALPRRLMLARSDEGLFALLHAVPAGADSFGRPGNVFSHGLLDRDLVSSLSSPAAARPLSWWRSTGWLTPFGPDEVRAAQFDDTSPPQPAQAVSTEDAVELLTSADAAVQSNTRLLLDAAAAALDGGLPVAVVAENVDEGVRWLATVLFLASPQSNAELTFSTYDRARAVLVNGSRTLLTVVLRADLDRSMVKASRVLLVDPRESAQLSDGGDGLPATWRTARGQEVPRSAWSQLVDAVCALGEDETRRTLAAIDEISALNPKPAASCPWWPLAVAVGENEALESAWALATQVLARTPGDAELDVDTRALFQDLVERASGNTRDDAHALLASLAVAAPDSTMLSISYRRYLERTLAEPEALALAQPLPLPALPPQTQQRVLADLEPYLVEVLETLGTTPMSGPDWTVRAVRLLSLLESSGLPVQNLGDAPRQALRRLGWALVVSGYGAPAVRQLEDTPAAVRRLVGTFVGQALALHANEPGRRMHSEVSDWLAPGYALAEICMDAAHNPPQDPLLQDLAVTRAPLFAGENPTLRLSAAITLLGSEKWRPGGAPAERVADALNQLAPGELWHPVELSWMLHHLPRRPDLDFSAAIARSVLEFAPDHASAQLAEHALADPDVATRLPADTSLVLSLLRRLGPTWFLDRAPDAAEAVLVGAVRCWPLLQRYPIRRRIAPHLLVAMLQVNANRGPFALPLAPVAGPTWQRQGFSRDLTDDIVREAVHGDLELLHLALREPGWQLAESLFVDTANRLIQRSLSKLRRPIFDLGVLYMDYPAEPAPVLPTPVAAADGAGDPAGVADASGNFYAGPVEQPQPTTPVGRLLLPYLREHRARLGDRLIEREEFSVAEARTAMAWVQETLQTVSDANGRSRARTKG